MTTDSTPLFQPATGRGSIPLLSVAFVLAFSVMLLVPVWAWLDVIDTGGGHGDHGGAQTVAAEAFRATVDAQTERYGQADGSVRVPDGEPVYVFVQQFAFTPNTIRLKRGAQHTLVFYAADVYHGVSLVHGGSLTTVLAPGTPVSLPIHVTEASEIEVRCTEYCGAAHHIMQARLIVEP